MAAILLTLSCNLAPAPAPTPTATATKRLGAVEATPGAETPAAAGVLWTGTVQTTTSADYGSAGVCNNEKWASSLDFIVHPDGSLGGSGRASLVSPPACSGPGAGHLKTDATNATFSVMGSSDGKVIHLQFSETSINGSTAGLFNYALLLVTAQVILDVPIVSPGHASLQTTVKRTMDVASVTAQHDVQLACQHCP